MLLLVVLLMLLLVVLLALLSMNLLELLFLTCLLTGGVLVFKPDAYLCKFARAFTGAARLAKVRSCGRASGWAGVDDSSGELGRFPCDFVVSLLFVAFGVSLNYFCLQLLHIYVILVILSVNFPWVVRTRPKS